MTNIRAALPKDLKQQNLSRILSIMCARKVFTISEIAELEGISRQTVTKALNYFMDKGIVVTGEKCSSTDVGGRRATTFTMNPDRYVICVMQYARKVHFALLDLTGKLLDKSNGRSSVELLDRPHEAYRFFVDSIKTNVMSLIERNNISDENIYGIMISIGGIVDSTVGVIRASMGFPECAPLIEDVRSELKLDVNIYCDNVAKVCAAGFILDSGELQKRVSAMYIDYGIGVNIIDSGVIPQTRNSITGELGHMVLDFNADTECELNDRGCFESLVSETYMREMADELTEIERNELLDGYNSNDDFRNHILKRADEGCEGAKRLSDYLAAVFGAAFRNIEFGFDPDAYLIQGSFTGWTKSFISKVKDIVRRNLYLKHVDFDIILQKKPTESMVDDGSIYMILSSILENE